MKIEELKERIGMLEVEVKMTVAGKQSSFNTGVSSINDVQRPARGEDGEFDSTRDLDERQILQKNKQDLSL